MKNFRKRSRTGLWVAMIFGMAMVFSASSALAKNTTLDNLMTAYNGESNAHAKYLAYAGKADKEGYHKVASLFRAAASAEEIHFKNHAQVIKSMGGTPTANIKLPGIKTTKENLADAVKGETYERDKMYPEFIAQAQKVNNADAIRTFTYAKAAEAEHAKLYRGALDNLAAGKAPKADFNVCPICGYTVQGKPAFESCPVCATPANQYKMVS